MLGSSKRAWCDSSRLVQATRPARRVAPGSHLECIGDEVRRGAVWGPFDAAGGGFCFSPWRMIKRIGMFALFCTLGIGPPHIRDEYWF